MKKAASSTVGAAGFLLRIMLTVVLVLSGLIGAVPAWAEEGETSTDAPIDSVAPPEPENSDESPGSASSDSAGNTDSEGGPPVNSEAPSAPVASEPEAEAPSSTEAAPQGFVTLSGDTPATDFTWRALNGTYATITGYTGNDSVISIPAEVGGHIVQAIESNAFEGDTRLDGVAFPDSLETIGDYAFAGCTSLTQVGFNSGLETIGERA
ncbi:MAG: leucine-rich repeat domain-containing protein, partial [Coriobacteriales bacterium]|nr:leucine-rich repeat domain-containing protein [Coriobacteriales bacterium]